MSDVQSVDVRVCHFPGCGRPTVPAGAGVGRPSQYCDDPAHDRGAAWRARKAAAQGAGAPVVFDSRPIDAARERASAIRGQVSGMIGLLQQQLADLVTELHTLADPDAAEAHIQSVTADAAELVATETARATRAETAQWDAETLRVEADAAAEEATLAAEAAEAALAEATVRISALEQDLTESVELHTAAVTANDTLQTQLAETTAALTVTVAERDAAQASLAQTKTLREAVQAELLLSRGIVAALTVERDSAVIDALRQKAHADERVTDLRGSFDGQLDRLRTDLEKAQVDAREQRTRADRAEGRTP